MNMFTTSKLSIYDLEVRLKCFCFYILHDSCSFLFYCFPVVDVLSQTGDIIEGVNIFNILLTVDSSNQRL